MEYTYEFLKKCHGLRFRATILKEHVEGIVKADDSPIILCYGKETLGNPDYFTRSKRVYLGDAQRFELMFGDFEIVPRDPDTYKDWHVGDKIAKYSRGKHREVIFRSGEVVIYKIPTNEEALGPYTCRELFEKGFRLILTDIEKQIIEASKKSEWEPQDGDVCYLRNNNSWIFVKKKDSSFDNAFYVSVCPKSDRIYYDGNIMNGKPMELRPATDEEKRRLFDVLAKDGKRWNAEKKVVEDIPKQHEFRKYDSVLVRDGDNEMWEVQVFGRYGREDEVFPYFLIDGPGYRQCLPLNEKTEHLIATPDPYEEEKP